MRIATSIGAFALLAISAAAGSMDGPGAVYAITNAPSGNAVVIYDRAANGRLSPAGIVASGGVGTGAGLGSQGAVIVSGDQRLLFAVNAGSNSVSSFRIVPDGLMLADTVSSGGPMPISLTFHHGLLYVLNAGAPNSISGFTVERSGKMSALAGSTRPLSAASTNPAQVSFSDDGDYLIVTEKATNLLDVYFVDREGRANGPFVQPSEGPTPFGFAVNKRNTLLVSEAGADGGASTYRITSTPGLRPVSARVRTGQQAACWAVITQDGRYGYVTNAGSGSISGFAIRQDGSARLLNEYGITAQPGGNPSDAALSHDSRYLYVRVAALRQIAVFEIRADGSLEALAPMMGTPAGVVGLAAF